MVQPVLTKAVLQTAKAAAMCMACVEYARPPPPIPLFLLWQNLSSKRIAPTDNMRPKSDDTKMHHQWLKGKPIVHTNSNLFSFVYGLQNAATQNSPADVTSVTFYWIAPPQPQNITEYNALPDHITFWYVQ